MPTVFCCLQINTPNKIFALKQNKYCAMCHVIHRSFLRTVIYTWKCFSRYLSAVWRTTVTVSALDCTLLRCLLTIDNFDWELLSSHFPCFWTWTLLRSARTEYCKHVWSRTATGSQQVLCRVPSVSQYCGQLFAADLGPVSAPSPSPASHLPRATTHPHQPAF